ncbi:MAG: hypothetical protein VX776_03585 [Planctomycetota bacterium]|nr:hypothetical protein [Planctomycetota bacterium]
MVKLIKQKWLAVLLVFSAGVTSALAQAPSAKPMAVIAINNYNDLSKDIGWVADLVGPPGTSAMIQAQGAQFEQMMDTTKPIGIVVQPDGVLGAKVLGFIPTNNLEQLVGMLALFGMTSQEIEGGLLELQTGATPVYIKKGNGWAFVSNNKETLATVPADPIPLLGGLEKEYDVAIKGNVDAVPPVFMQLAMSQIQAGLQASTAQPLPGETEQDFETRRAQAMKSMEDMQKALNDMKSVIFGLNIDQTRESVYVDFGIDFKEGSESAKAADYSDVTTNLSAFSGDNAAVTMSMAGKIDPIQGAQVAVQIDTLRDQAINQLQNDPNIPTDEMRALATKTVSTLVDVVNGTLADGEFDMAASVTMDDGMGAIGAIRAAQADSLENVFRELVSLAKEQDPEFPPVNLDAMKHAGATFHTMSVPVPPFDPQAQAIFGEAIDISIGMSADHIYFGLGKGNLAKIKSAMDASAANKGAEAEPMKMEMSMSKVLTFAAEQAQDPTMQQAAAATGTKDKTRMLLIPIENGAKFRIELEAGVLKAISVGAQAAQSQIEESPF